MSALPGTRLSSKNTLPYNRTAHWKIYWQSNSIPFILCKGQTRVMEEKADVSEEGGEQLGPYQT